MFFFFFIPVIFHLIFPDWSWPQVTTETATRRASVCFIVDSPRFPKVLATILWVVSISSFLYEFAQAALPLPWTEWFRQQTFLTFPEARSPRSRCRVRWFLARDLSPAGGLPSSCSHFSYKRTDPSRGLRLITCQRLCLHVLSHWGSGFQHINFGETHSVHITLCLTAGYK